MWNFNFKKQKYLKYVTFDATKYSFIMDRIKFLIKDFFDKETGFFTYLFDKKCFKKKNIEQAKRILPTLTDKNLLAFAKSAYQLQEGYAEELLIEIAKRQEKNAP